MSKGFKLKISSRIFNKKTKKQSFLTKKHCKFCGEKEALNQVNYKNVAFLKGFLTERYKILPSKVSGNCFYHQRILSNQIKIARSMALLPYCAVLHI